jgi:dimeric dUTPase (all-alpha-NTP-PPase superfamily)
MIKNEIVKAVNKINEMVEMQKILNNAIMKEKGLTFGDDKFNKHTLKRAIIDEVGELNHELKATWCWWKDTQKPVDNLKVLEELVDVWHFVMSEYYLVDILDDIRQHDITTLLLEGIKTARTNELYKNDPVTSFLDYGYELDELIALTFSLGYDIDDVYDMYITKNKINFERLKNGY